MERENSPVFTPYTVLWMIQDGSFSRVIDAMWTSKMGVSSAHLAHAAIAMERQHRARGYKFLAIIGLAFVVAAYCIFFGYGLSRVLSVLGVVIGTVVALGCAFPAKSAFSMAEDIIDDFACEDGQLGRELQYLVEFLDIEVEHFGNVGGKWLRETAREKLVEKALAVRKGEKQWLEDLQTAKYVELDDMPDMEELRAELGEAYEHMQCFDLSEGGYGPYYEEADRRLASEK